MASIGLTLAGGAAASMLAASFQDCKNVAGGFLVKDTSAKCGPQTEIKMKLDSLSQSITTNIQNFVTNSTTNITTVQDQAISIRGNCCPGGIDISQRTNLDVKVMTEIDETFAMEQINEVKEAIKLDLQQVSKQVNDILNNGSSGRTTLDIKQHVQTILENESTITSVRDAVNNLAVGQNQRVALDCPLDTNKNIDYRGSDGVCRINQELVAKVQADVIINTCFDILKRDSLIKEVQTAISQHSTVENRGLTDIVDSVMDFFKSLNMMIIVVVIGAILLLPVLFMVWKKMKNKGVVSEAAIAQFLRSRRG